MLLIASDDLRPTLEVATAIRSSRRLISMSSHLEVSDSIAPIPQYPLCNPSRTSFAHRTLSNADRCDGQRGTTSRALTLSLFLCHSTSKPTVTPRFVPAKSFTAASTTPAAWTRRGAAHFHWRASTACKRRGPARTAHSDRVVVARGRRRIKWRVPDGHALLLSYSKNTWTQPFFLAVGSADHQST